MKNLEKEILEIIVNEMEVYNQGVIENSNLSEEEKEMSIYPIEDLEGNETVKKACIEAMKKGLIKFAIDYLYSHYSDSLAEKMYNIMNDVLDAYDDSL